MKLPNELILIIYNYSDIDTNININKIMNWRFNVKNPFRQEKIPYISKTLKNRTYKYLKYYNNIYSKLYNQSHDEIYTYSFVLTPEFPIPSGHLNV